VTSCDRVITATLNERDRFTEQAHIGGLHTHRIAHQSRYFHEIVLLQLEKECPHFNSRGSEAESGSARSQR
jgi:hypothetical protein